MPKDYGHIAGNEAIRYISNQVKSIYSRAYKETQEKLSDYLEAFRKRDIEKKKLVDAGKLTQDEYLKWRKNQMLTGKRWEDMATSLSKDLVNADKIAVDIINSKTPDVYAVNMNYGTYRIENMAGINTGFTLYDRDTVNELMKKDPKLLPKSKIKIPKDLRWNKQHIANEVTQGILQGESIKKVAKRLRNVTDMDYRASVRNARTTVTGAQNAGRTDAFKRAEKMGIKIKQRWLATGDSRTRDSHVSINGETVNIGEKFSNGCRYPGDPDGRPEEVYNCRCTLVPELDILQENKEEIIIKDESVQNETFNEWMNKRKEE